MKHTTRLLVALLLLATITGCDFGCDDEVTSTGYYQWLPALVFQIVLALWLIIKGVATPTARAR